MSRIPFSFPLQEVTESASQLVSTLSNLSVETKTSILIPLLVGASYTIYKENKTHHEKLHGLFNLTWKNSSSIKPEEILGNRPFNEYYYARAEDEKVRNCIENEKSVLIVGAPLGGKTRMVYEALRSSKKYDLIIPRAKSIDIESFILPKQIKFWIPKIMFIDNLHRFVELQNFEYLFDICRKNKINLIATCRSGIEYEKTKRKLLDKNIDLETEIFNEIIALKEVSEEQGKKVAEKVGKNWNDTRFNKTIGSIFMPLAEMNKRFSSCTPEEKSILKAIKKLYICGVYDEDQNFRVDLIQKVSENEGVKKEKYQWEEVIKKLSEEEFIKSKERDIDKIWAEEVYLEDIVMLNYSDLRIFEEMLSVFKQYPDELFKIGNRAYEIGSVVLQKAKYMKIVIEAFQNALKIFTEEQFPLDYAMTQNNIGTAYRKLAEVEDKAQNCKKAIEAFQNALRIRTEEQFPIQYAATQNNIGTAYDTMAEIEDKAQNCKKAIEAHQNALRIRTEEQFPMDYATTQNNIGSAYTTLAEVENKVQNSKKAIEAFENALRIRTLDQFPMDYAMTQNNLGVAYETLAEVESKAQNCKKAIEAYQNALKIFTQEQFPIQYATTQNNIGVAYRKLAEVEDKAQKVEDKAQNCKKAIEAFENALTISTVEQFPMDYAMTQNNIGTAYRKLAEVEDIAQNCKKSIEAYQNALKITTVEQFPIQYAATQKNLSLLIQFCKNNDIQI